MHTLPYPDGVVLPNGYKRCEYLTFDGNSYINTRVKTANNLTISVTWLTNVRQRILIGARTSTQLNQLIFGYFANGTSFVFNYGTTRFLTDIGINLTDGVKHTAIFDSQGVTIDSVFYIQDSKELTEFLDIYLGSWNTNNNSQSNENRKFQGNIYDTIISNTQGKLWHGIPCLDGNDVPCFYDIVSQTAFYNQGSGSFTYKLYPQPTEIWSCGEYNATDGKYHILVQPQGGSIADIALDEPLRKVNSVADSIEFPSGTEGKALVTRNLGSEDIGNMSWNNYTIDISSKYRCGSSSLINVIKRPSSLENIANILTIFYSANSIVNILRATEGIGVSTQGVISVYDENYNQSDSAAAFTIVMQGVELIYELATPTTELVDAPQIAEAESYTCVINQGGKAVSWSSFETNSE